MDIVDNINDKYLSQRMKKILDDTVGQLFKTVTKVPADINYLKSLKPEKLFEVTMTDEAKKLFHEGQLHFEERKDGLGYMPILVDNNNKYGKQVGLKETLIKPDMVNALNNIAIQQQLTQLEELLEDMNQSLGEILLGQQNDRIALFYSAKQQYLEAQSTKNDMLKKLCLANAIKTANDSRFQLMETANADIKFICDIPTDGLGFIVDRTKSKKIEATSNKIRYAFKIMNDATGICAASYAELGEKEALETCLEPYQRFIQKNLIPLEENKEESSPFWHLQLYDGNSDNMWIHKPTQINDKLNDLKKICKAIDGDNVIINLSLNTFKE